MQIKDNSPAIVLTAICAEPYNKLIQISSFGRMDRGRAPFDLMVKIEQRREMCPLLKRALFKKV